MKTDSSVNDWRDTPNVFLEAVQKAESSVANLQFIAKSLGLERKFTLDGRLVGDIGELLLCKDFKVLPSEKPDGHAHDLVGECDANRVQVQVKLRRATKEDGRIEFKYQPQCLVVIECSQDWRQWRIVYNGPGTVVTENGIELRPKDRRILRNGARYIIRLSRQQLRDAAHALTPGTLRLEPRLTY